MTRSKQAARKSCGEYYRVRIKEKGGIGAKEHTAVSSLLEAGQGSLRFKEKVMEAGYEKDRSVSVCAPKANRKLAASQAVWGRGGGRRIA